MAIAVHPDGSFAYWKDNSKLQWATAIDIAADPGHTYTMVTTSHNTSSSFDCSSSLPSRDSFVASKQLYHHEDFRPSRALLGAQRVIAPDMRRRALEAGVDVDNLKYQGDITSSTIENHLCPNALSCSVHIVGIAAESTAKDILDAIYEGGIAKLSIKPPKGTTEHLQSPWSSKQSHLLSCSWRELIVSRAFASKISESWPWIIETRRGQLRAPSYFRRAYSELRDLSPSTPTPLNRSCIPESTSSSLIAKSGWRTLGREPLSCHSWPLRDKLGAL